MLNRLTPRPARIEAEELIDGPGVDRDALVGNLADLAAINRWFGGAWLSLQALGRATGSLGPGASLSVLDLATGQADIPRAVARWAARRRLRPFILASDISLPIVRIAAAGPATTVAFGAADAGRLPFRDGSFDIVMCSLALHHLDPEAAVSMLREMARVARRAVLVNDLVRSWVGYWGALALGRLISDNPLTRHDGPISVRRAYTRAEMGALAAQAGLPQVSFQGLLGYRVVMTSLL